MQTSESNIVGQRVRIGRPLPSDHTITQTISGIVEWHSEDLLNFRLSTFGHCGIGRSDTLEVLAS